MGVISTGWLIRTMYRDVAQRLGPVRPVLGVRSGPASGDLHHQCHRVAQLPTPKDHQEPGPLPSDTAAVKLLWLAIRNIEDKRARERAKEAGRPKGTRKAPGKLIDGSTVHGPNAALGELALVYPERFDPYL